MFSVHQEDVCVSIYDALTVIQHRGQDSAGIATTDNVRYCEHKQNGMVRDVFGKENMKQLTGHMGIGHCRYPTAGTASSMESQPFFVNSPYGISLAHNGNLTNTSELAEDLKQTDNRHLNTSSDSEVLLNVFAHELAEVRKNNPDPADIFEAVRRVHERIEGAYAVVAIIIGVGLIAFRDPNAIRPLVIGQRTGPKGTDTLVVSESVAMGPIGFELLRDVLPGEAVFVDLDGTMHSQQCADASSTNPCIFEYVYLARPESFIDEVSVYKARLRMGDFLAQKILREWGDEHIDVVIPIPDTSRTSALPIAHQLNVKYREGFIKNRYIGRTFIMPGQEERQKNIRKKLNAIPLEFEGKNVLLVDDSIVRGNTSRQIIQMARDAGAQKVFFASAAPPVRYQNVYGIDMPATYELIAHDRDVDQIRIELGADRLIYQDLDDLVKSITEGNPKINECDTSCFTGDYVTGVSPEYLHGVAASRNDEAKKKAS